MKVVPLLGTQRKKAKIESRRLWRLRHSTSQGRRNKSREIGKEKKTTKENKRKKT